MSPGVLALVGGDEWTAGCDFDADLLDASGSDKVVVLPTAAAFERPERRVLAAAEWFAGLGAEVQGLMVASRADAQDDDAAAIVGAARFLYLSGGSPLHLRSVLKGSKVFAALREAWGNGAVVAGAGAGALVLSDPMVDPRGGALTVGLGLIEGLAVVPLVGDFQEDAHGEKLHRAVLLAPPGVPVVGIPGRTALLRDPDGRWRSRGQGRPSVYVDGRAAVDGLGALAGL
ncbi:MAG: Type 1 glutamine amidotransferase-like domain-containing protein [Actinomycetota bacterium]|nr:Type 1 glutamine amidotransferase-like domain-containing protein [Actinomycetota bacterium]